MHLEVLATTYDERGLPISQTLLVLGAADRLTAEQVEHLAIHRLEVTTFVGGQRVDYAPLRSAHKNAGGGR